MKNCDPFGICIDCGLVCNSVRYKLPVNLYYPPSFKRENKSDLNLMGILGSSQCIRFFRLRRNVFCVYLGRNINLQMKYF